MKMISEGSGLKRYLPEEAVLEMLRRCFVQGFLLGALFSVTLYITITSLYAWLT